MGKDSLMVRMDWMKIKVESRKAELMVLSRVLLFLNRQRLVSSPAMLNESYKLELSGAWKPWHSSGPLPIGERKVA